MNPLLIKIIAVGLTLSQLFNKPIEQFKPQFSVESEQPEVEQVLRDGCQFISKEFGTEKVDFDVLFGAVIGKIESAQESVAPTDPSATNVAPPAPSTKTEPSLTSKSLSADLDIPGIYAAYKQFCKGEKVEKSPIQLNEVIAYFNKTMADLPDHAKLKGLKLSESTLILDGDGKRFTEVYNDNNRRRFISIKEIPTQVQKAFIAAEDKRFYQHHGLDLRGIIRAFINSAAKSGRPQGGSTITQQVVKNLLTGDDLTFERKMREMVLAVRVEKIMSKEEILELYLNYVFLGRASWGVDMAAQTYFGKSVKQVDLAEASLLAALTKGPNFYDPVLHPERMQDRREYVLARMKEDAYILESAFGPAVSEKPKVIEFESPKTRSAFYFLDEIQREAKRIKGIESLTSASYVVKSTIHRELQKSAEKALQDGLVEYEESARRSGTFDVEGSLVAELQKYRITWQEALPKVHPQLYDIQWPLAVILPAEVDPKAKPGARTGPAISKRIGLSDGSLVNLVNTPAEILRKLKPYDLVHIKMTGTPKAPTAMIRVRPAVQGAIVVLEAKTGKVLAMSGGFSYAVSQLNRVTRTARQPGSTLKPFIYLAALDLGYQPNTLIPDVPITLPPIERGAKYWSPHDYEQGSNGVVTIRRAVENSLNLPTVRIMSQMGQTPSEGLDYIRGVTQKLGIYKAPDRHYPFVLGAEPARVLDMAVAYATIANIGLRPTPTFIDSIDQNGHEIYHRPRFDLKPVDQIDRISFYQIRHILEGTVARGTAIKLKDLSGFVAGKTGTSNNQNDAWFIGFTNDLVVATWVGYDNLHIRASLGDGFTGARVALPIAEKVIRESFKVYKDKEPLQGPPAEILPDIVEYPIDVRSGEFNAGNYPEIFRIVKGQPGVPRNTIHSILRPEELTMPLAENEVGDQQNALFKRAGGDAQNTSARPSGFDAGGSSESYRPGVEDPYESARRRNRQVDPFLIYPGMQNR